MQYYYNIIFRLFQKYIINSNNSTRAFAYSAELLKYKANLELLNELEKWKIPKFPVDGNMLRKEGVTGNFAFLNKTCFIKFNLSFCF